MTRKYNEKLVEAGSLRSGYEHCQNYANVLEKLLAKERGIKNEDEMEDFRR